MALRETRAAETGNRPIRVIRAGLPNPARASGGDRTPVAISRPRLSSPVSSGARAPVMNRTIARARTARGDASSLWHYVGVAEEEWSGVNALLHQEKRGE